MRYIALLRGINLGGKTMIKMDALKAEFEALGFKNVASYINSGNLAFDTAKTAESKLESKIEKEVEKLVARNVDVMVREQKYIDRVIGANPFKGSYESHKHMHVVFLKDEMPAEKAQLLRDSAKDGERYDVKDREVYCLLPRGVADSVLFRGFFDKKPKVSYTARNWRTVEKLAEL